MAKRAEDSERRAVWVAPGWRRLRAQLGVRGRAPAALGISVRLVLLLTIVWAFTGPVDRVPLVVGAAALPPAAPESPTRASPILTRLTLVLSSGGWRNTDCTRWNSVRQGSVAKPWIDRPPEASASRRNCVSSSIFRPAEPRRTGRAGSCRTGGGSAGSRVARKGNRYAGRYAASRPLDEHWALRSCVTGRPDWFRECERSRRTAKKRERSRSMGSDSVWWL